ncbi:hypothetical protein Tco_1142539, partial [Tanacetum coccineum]
IPVILVVPTEVPITPAYPLVALEVGAVLVISPTRVLDLVDYSSSSDSDPSKDSLPIAPELPLVSPFLCSDDSEADNESEPAEQRPKRHESLTPSFEFPLAPVVASPGIHRRPSILIRPVGPFPERRLAWRRVSHRSSDRHSSPDFTSNSSSSSSSSDSSSNISLGSSSDSLSDSSSVHSSGCDASGHEAFIHWRSAPLSTLYPPTTSESSLGSSFERSLDLSSPSAGPSRKRCRSPATLIPLSTLVSRSVALALANLPPHKRFKDSYSSKVSRGEHIEIGTADAETVADLGISKGVRAHTEDGIGMDIEVATSDIRKDEEEFEAEANAGGTMKIAVDPLVTNGISKPARGDTPDLEGTLYDTSHYMCEVPLDRITEFETAQRQLEAGQLVASRERAGSANWVRSLGRQNLRIRALLCIKRDRVDSLRRHMALSQEEFR